MGFEVSQVSQAFTGYTLPAGNVKEETKLLHLSFEGLNESKKRKRDMR